MSEKLNSKLIRDLLKVKEDGNLYHRESQHLEFKESFNFAGLAEYYKDFSAFANNKGGYLIFGVKDRPKRELIGLSLKAKTLVEKLDPETISGHLLDIFSSNISWEHEIYTFDNKTFCVFYIHEAHLKPVICKMDNGKEQILKNGEVYFRYGGRTQKIQYAELENIINQRISQNNSQWMDLVTKIGKSGPENAAILDTEKGLIEKYDSQILVVDEELIKNIQWIKEGEFSETKGKTTLKLVGNVQPIDHVEVIKKVKENILKEYPITAKQLCIEVKNKHNEIKQNRIYEIIRENGLKDNKEYSTYVFRNNTQQIDYEKNSIVASGVASIYKQSCIDFISNIHKNDKKIQL